jgi:hypothetical protein
MAIQAIRISLFSDLSVEHIGHQFLGGLIHLFNPFVEERIAKCFGKEMPKKWQSYAADMGKEICYTLTVARWVQ